MKRIIAGFIVLGLILNGYVVQAQEPEQPSPWAAEMIDLAKADGYVLQELESRYTQPIKRYEYVLLALMVLDKNGDSIQVVDSLPFIDIGQHLFQKQIVKAYNAGIIKGYGDGRFDPDKDITRQEMAVLITNLLKRMDPQRTISGSAAPFKDRAEIGSWALAATDYCYANNIIKGKLNNGVYMEPDGKASIEQSIIMIHRLAVAEGIPQKFDLGTIPLQVSKPDNQMEQVETKAIRDFAAGFSYSTGVIVKLLVDQQQLIVTDISHQLLEAKNEQAEVLKLAKYDTNIRLVAIVKEKSATDPMVSHYEALLKTYGVGLDQVQPIPIAEYYPDSDPKSFGENKYVYEYMHELF